MKQLYLPLLLAAGMIAIALVTTSMGLPDEVALVATFLPLSLFPSLWLRNRNACNPLTRCN